MPFPFGCFSSWTVHVSSSRHSIRQTVPDECRAQPRTALTGASLVLQTADYGVTTKNARITENSFPEAYNHREQVTADSIVCQPSATFAVKPNSFTTKAQRSQREHKSVCTLRARGLCSMTRLQTTHHGSQLTTKNARNTGKVYQVHASGAIGCRMYSLSLPPSLRALWIPCGFNFRCCDQQPHEQREPV